MPKKIRLHAFNFFIHPRGSKTVVSNLLDLLELSLALVCVLSAKSGSPTPPKAEIFLTHSETVRGVCDSEDILCLVFCQNGLHFRLLCKMTHETKTSAMTKRKSTLKIKI
jgi:hypothetical protein